MKIGILGHFGDGVSLLNGQTIKTKSLVNGLERYTDTEIVRIDTYGWIKKPILLLRLIKRAFIDCDVIIALPAENGLKVFAPLLLHYKKKYDKKIFYDVVGGWLPEFLDEKKWLSATLMSFDSIWVETYTMKAKLEAQGFKNVTVVPNFKELQILKSLEIVSQDDKPLKLCTFSRVMKEKGIGIAVDAVHKANELLGYTAFTLDIYGQLQDGQEEWFNCLKRSFSSYVRYCGCVESSKSVEVLKGYFALLFPTHYEGEGFAGTLIDAYSAGVPVIASDWRYNAELVNEKTGYVYPVTDNDALVDILVNVGKNPSILISKKKDCLEEAEKYKAETVISYLISIM